MWFVSLAGEIDHATKSEGKRGECSGLMGSDHTSYPLHVCLEALSLSGLPRSCEGHEGKEEEKRERRRIYIVALWFLTFAGFIVSLI